SETNSAGGAGDDRNAASIECWMMHAALLPQRPSMPNGVCSVFGPTWRRGVPSGALPGAADIKIFEGCRRGCGKGPEELARGATLAQATGGGAHVTRREREPALAGRISAGPMPDPVVEQHDFAGHDRQCDGAPIGLGPGDVSRRHDTAERSGEALAMAARQKLEATAARGVVERGPDLQGGRIAQPPESATVLMPR